MRSRTYSKKRILPACVVLAGALAWVWQGVLGVPGSGEGFPNDLKWVGSAGTQESLESDTYKSPGVALHETDRTPSTEKAVGSEGSLGDAEDPAEGDQTYTNAPWDRDGRLFSMNDLEVLRDIIELNGLTEDSSPTDYDDGDGFFEPIEFGYQVWRAGVLVELSLGPNEYFSFGYELKELPDSIGDLGQLTKLDLSSNKLIGLPESIGFLARLEVLRLARNQLLELPEHIWGLGELRELVLSENLLMELPEELGELSNLESLHLTDNPLAYLPDTAGGLRSLQILALNRHAKPDEALMDVRLSRLPRSMEDLGSLEDLHISGNSLYCEALAFDPPRVPRFLVSRSGKHVHGLAHQWCPDE